MRIFLLIFTFQLTTFCFGQNKVNTNEDIMEKFEKFKNKEKFVQDNELHYLGVAESKMRPILSKKINQAADDFRLIAKSKNPTNKEYLKKINIGLSRFSNANLYLDTEDRERVCLYFEELMDIVGLESSDGQLNKFLYGFNPTELMDKN